MPSVNTEENNLYCFASIKTDVKDKNVQVQWVNSILIPSSLLNQYTNIIMWTLPISKATKSDILHQQK